jgi:hypothetical protein
MEKRKQLSEEGSSTKKHKSDKYFDVPASHAQQQLHEDSSSDEERDLRKQLSDEGCSSEKHRSDKYLDGPAYAAQQQSSIHSPSNSDEDSDFDNRFPPSLEKVAAPQQKKIENQEEDEEDEEEESSATTKSSLQTVQRNLEKPRKAPISKPEEFSVKREGSSTAGTMHKVHSVLVEKARNFLQSVGRTGSVEVHPSQKQQKATKVAQEDEDEDVTKKKMKVVKAARKTCP